MTDNLRDELAAVLEPFEAQLKQRDAEEKKHGEALADTTAKVEELSLKLTDLADIKSRLDIAEARLNNPDVGDAEDKSVETGTADSDEYREIFVKALTIGKENLSKAESEIEQKVLSEAVDTTAGYLVAPPDFVREIIKPIDEFSAMRGLARIRTTGTRSLQVPKRTGTFSAAKVAEQGTRSETTGLTFGLLEIPVHEWHARVDITQNQLEDSAFNMEQVLSEEFSAQFLVAEGDDFTRGNSVGGAQGFMDDAAGLSSVNSGHATTFDSIDPFITLQHSVKSGYWGRAVWGMSRATIGVLRTIKDGVGQYLWDPSQQAADPNMFLGNRVVEMPDMPAIAASAYPVVFGDFFTAYTIVDRLGIAVMRDPYSSKNSGAIEFTARKRWGGQVVLAEALYRMKISA